MTDLRYLLTVARRMTLLEWIQGVSAMVVIVALALLALTREGW